MNSTFPQISIALHLGLPDRWPLFQNLLKSFLVTNSYPAIELILIESGENRASRDWLESLNFDEPFVNFDGTTTSIQKKPSVCLEKTLMFIDDPNDGSWGNPEAIPAYQVAHHKTINYFKGKYLVSFPEDCQFIIF